MRGVPEDPDPLTPGGETLADEVSPVPSGSERASPGPSEQGKKLKVSRGLSVEQVVRMSALPEFWVVPKVPTAYLLDLRQDPTEYRNSGGLMTMDAIIKSHVSFFTLIIGFLSPYAGSRRVGWERLWRE